MTYNRNVDSIFHNFCAAVLWYGVMNRKNRLAQVIAGMLLTCVCVLSIGSASNAEGRNVTGSMVAGISAVLMPAPGTNAKDVIETTAKELNIELGVKRNSDQLSDLVMANVHQSLNVREEPDVHSKRVGLMYKDCGGTILDRQDGWTKLKSGNVVGWCSDEFLLFDEEAKTLAKNVGITLAKVSTDTLRVRDEPWGDSEIIGLVPKDEVHEVIGDSDGEWIKIDYEGTDGYVVAEYVDIKFNIDAGETNEEIKERELAELEAKRHVNYGAYTTDADTTLLLAALIQCEAGGEAYDGQLAVGACVMNRVRSPAYPNTIHAVIYASGQFTPALNGKVNAVYSSGRIKQSCVQAANEAISGVSNIGDYTHFRRNDGRMGIVIGNHVFY